MPEKRKKHAKNVTVGGGGGTIELLYMVIYMEEMVILQHHPDTAVQINVNVLLGGVWLRLLKTTRISNSI